MFTVGAETRRWVLPHPALLGASMPNSNTLLLCSPQRTVKAHSVDLGVTRKFQWSARNLQIWHPSTDAQVCVWNYLPGVPPSNSFTQGGCHRCRGRILPWRQCCLSANLAAPPSPSSSCPHASRRPCWSGGHPACCIHNLTRGSRKRPGGVKRARHWADSPGVHKTLLPLQHQDLNPAQHRLEASQGQFCETGRREQYLWAQQRLFRMTSEMLVIGEHCQQGKDSFLPKTTTPQVGGQGQHNLHKDGLSIYDQNCGPVQKRPRSDQSMLGFLGSSMSSPRKRQEEIPIHNGLSLTSKFIYKASTTHIPKPAKDHMRKLKPISLMNTDVNILRLNTSKLNSTAY